jgi:hypothetical protein
MSLASALLLLLVVAWVARNAEPEQPLLPSLATLFALAHATLAMHAVSGMESALFATLIATATGLVALERADAASRARSSLLLGVLLVVAGLCRPETPLYAGLLVLLYARRAGLRPAAASALIFALGYGSYFAARYAHFGHPFPNTYYAKVDADAASLGFGVGHVEGFLLLHAGALGLTGLILALRRARPWALPLLAVALANLVSTALLGGDIFPLFRFLLPSLMPVAIGIAYLVTRLASSAAHPVRASITLALAIVAVQLAAPHLPRFALLGVAPSPPSDFRKVREIGAISADYERLATWMVKKLPPDTSIALSAIGIIPYRTRMETIDMLGLTDAHIAHAPSRGRPGPFGHARHDARYVLSREPDVIFVDLPRLYDGAPEPAALNRRWTTSPMPADRELMDTAAFHERYRPVIVRVDARSYTAFFVKHELLPLLMPKARARDRSQAAERR